MQRNALRLWTALLLLPAAAAQADFQHQASVALGTSSDDFGDGLVQSRYAYYFAPVQVGDAPYRLNTFLSPQSTLRVSYGFDSNVDLYGVGGTFHSEGGWLAGADYGRLEVFGSTTDSLSLALGYDFQPGQRVTARYATLDREWGFDSSTYSIDYLGYFDLASTAGIAVNAGWAHTEYDGVGRDNDNLTLAAAWYLTQSWYLGADYLYFDDGGDSDDTWVLSTGYWWQFADHFALTADLSRFLDSGASGVAINLGFQARF
ncbi:putative porin [Ferrimonas balearica]|uniref:putative porin n=1 Tax=Ferrimonas balearica TaxID=44012 RepID=UPI001C998619|nr:putative porin [Ferrimonas balearica]MBY5993001.1 hypothetical protein [Ferrimonas balearica]